MQRHSPHSTKYFIDIPFNYVLLVGMSLFFWIAGYSESAGYPVYSGVSSTPLWATVCRMLPNKAVTYLIGVLLLAGGAFLIYRANYMLIIIREKTYMPFLFYLIFISSNTDFFPLNSASLGVFCLILAFYQILTTYHNTNVIPQIYNSALLIGAGSLLWVHILWFVPVFWYGMYSFKSMTLRTFLAFLTGLATVYWFLLGWCVWTEDFSFFSIPFASLLKTGFPAFGLGPVDWLSMGCLLSVGLLAVVNILLHEYDDSLRTRQFLFFIILFGIVPFGLSFIYEQQSTEFLEVSCMPLAILIAHFFTTSKSRWLKWLYYLFMALFLLLAILRSPWSFLPPDVLGK
ncbi:hypothetical protein FACS1894181_16020 [Bacteroidia bacterium]|nr:hypothetical protein FACS1894181_16020 [Bacteroidia bacterium]